MNKVQILIEGYAKKIDNGWVASSTTTFIESNGKKIIVDPGCNRQKLLEELAKSNLEPSNIDFVLLTHNHTDHVLLTGIFENAKVLNRWEIYDNDRQTSHNEIVPETDLKLVITPGHDPDHYVVIVPSENEIYAIAGDLFWWQDSEEQKTDYDSLIKHPDPYVKDKNVIEESRKLILEAADYIIPGHGQIFKVEK